MYEKNNISFNRNEMKLVSIFIVLSAVESSKAGLKRGIIEAEELLVAMVDTNISFRFLECGISPYDRFEFEKEHIPGALYFDALRCIGLQEFSSLVPGNVTRECFQSYATGVLELSKNDNIVLYDCFSRAPGIVASRVWWLFRVFGQHNVSVLNGGLESWNRLGITKTEAGRGFDSCVFRGRTFGDQLRISREPSFEGIIATLDSGLFKTFDQVFDNIRTKEFQLIDSRSSEEFYGISGPRIPGKRIAKEILTILKLKEEKSATFQRL
ncbi:hypothetical protein ACOME3_002224 [Neoechinorhynchus agilis]